MLEYAFKFFGTIFVASCNNVLVKILSTSDRNCLNYYDMIYNFIVVYLFSQNLDSNNKISVNDTFFFAIHIDETCEGRIMNNNKNKLLYNERS